jgi:hypothetical protein
VSHTIRAVNLSRTPAFRAELTSSSAITRHTRMTLSAQLAARHYFID